MTSLCGKWCNLASSASCCSCVLSVLVLLLWCSAALDPVFPATTCAVDLSAAVHGCLHKYMYIVTFILALQLLV